MDSPVGTTLANSFLCHHKKRWLDKCPEEFKPVFYRGYVDDIFVLFIKEEHLKLFLNYFNSCHENIKFTSEKETNNKLSFLDIEISRDKNLFITSVYGKPTFSGVFSHYDSFISRGYKFNLASTLIFAAILFVAVWNFSIKRLWNLKKFLKRVDMTLSFDRCLRTF